MTGRLQPEALVSVPSFARAQGVDRKTAYRRLTRLHTEDRESGRGGWLLVAGPRRKLMLNLSYLRREHPGLFERDFVRRDEHEDLVSRVERLEGATAYEKKRLNAVSASVRDARTELKRGQSGAVRGAENT